MIVESLGGQAKKSGRVILQRDHQNLALEFAKLFGNEQFTRIQPQDLMLFCIEHHDHGWNEVDANIGRNPDSGLPYSLVSTPIDQLLQTGPNSADFNEEYHPYCGLLSSMHVWGLYNGRYGLSDKVVVSMLQGEAQKNAQAMLDLELERQLRLKNQLSQDPLGQSYLEEEALFCNYKLLQFFDTLSLYFNEKSDARREASSFQHVPLNSKKDCTVEITRIDQNTYKMDPYPFCKSQIRLNLPCYEIPYSATDVDYKSVFHEAEQLIEPIVVVK